MKHIFICVLSVYLSACSFSKPGSDGTQTFSQSEFGLTVDWLMEGQTQPDATLKAVRLLNPSGETYKSDAPITLPAQVPQSLILMGEFAQSQINQEIDFLRAVVRFGEKVVYVPAQLVAEEPLGGKRRLTFQVTGLNAAFRTEKSTQGLLHIEIFARSQRIGILEAGIRTPPSDVTIESSDIKAFETREAQGDTSEYLKPIIAGKQMNLVRVLKYTNSENLPVQIQTPRRTKGTLTQWVNRISYSQAECSYSYSNNPADEVLGSDILILPLDDRFITEAERTVNSPEVIGDISTVLQAGAEAVFGIYALGEGSDRWMNEGPARAEVSVASVTASCGSRCIQLECESKPGPDRFTSAFSFLGCHCEEHVRTYNRVNINTGIDRGAVTLNIPKNATTTPLRFADVEPHRDGEVRITPVLNEKSNVTWLQ